MKSNTIFKCLTHKVSLPKEHVTLSLKSYKKRKRNKKQKHFKNPVPRKYKDYICSIFWRMRKNEYYKKYGKFCFVCKSTNYINLHHIVYGEYGYEKDENLIPLCDFHHNLFHEQYELSGNMSEQTLEFVVDQTDLLRLRNLHIN